jgi:hypothetical protein
MPVVLFHLHPNRLASQAHVDIATFIRDVVCVCAQCFQSQVILHRMEEGEDVTGWHANPFYVPPGQLPADEAVSCRDIRWKANEIDFSLGLVVLVGGFKHPSNLLLAVPIILTPAHHVALPITRGSGPMYQGDKHSMSAGGMGM